MPPSQPVTYARRVGLFSGTMMVVGGIIGAGIFLNPAVVAQRVGTVPLILGVWLAGAVVAVLGAFIFGELGARRPEAGGGYAYLREAYGPLPAFLQAWTLLLVISSGAIAAVGLTFATYASSLFGLSPAFATPLALGAIVLLTGINVVGVAPAAVTGNVFTLLKLAALALLIGAGALLAHRVPVPPPPAAVPGNPLLAAAAGLVPVLFAFGGWQQTNFVAEELVEPERNLPRALLLGVAIVVVVYLAANAVYLRTLGATGLAASTAPASDAMTVLLGPWGRTAIAAGITASTFGFLHVVILVSPRVYQAMARDGTALEPLARLHPRFRTPAIALLVQGAWASVLVLTGTYGELLDYAAFGDWLFFALVASTLFVFRRRDPAGAAPRFRTPFYPWSVLVFIAAGLYTMLGTIAANPWNAARGAGLILAGIPVYLLVRRRR
jgi:APA family basic amino acid/polyamine antiporter